MQGFVNGSCLLPEQVCFEGTCELGCVASPTSCLLGVCGFSGTLAFTFLVQLLFYVLLGAIFRGCVKCCSCQCCRQKPKQGSWSRLGNDPNDDGDDNGQSLDLSNGGMPRIASPIPSSYTSRFCPCWPTCLPNPLSLISFLLALLLGCLSYVAMVNGRFGLGLGRVDLELCPNPFAPPLPSPTPSSPSSSSSPSFQDFCVYPSNASFPLPTPTCSSKQLVTLTYEPSVFKEWHSSFSLVFMTNGWIILNTLWIIDAISVNLFQWSLVVRVAFQPSFWRFNLLLLSLLLDTVGFAFVFVISLYILRRPGLQVFPDADELTFQLYTTENVQLNLDNCIVWSANQSDSYSSTCALASSAYQVLTPHGISLLPRTDCGIAEAITSGLAAEYDSYPKLAVPVNLIGLCLVAYEWLELFRNDRKSLRRTTNGLRRLFRFLTGRRAQSNDSEVEFETLATSEHKG